MKVVIDEEKIIDLLEIQWGYEGIREDVQRMLRENGVPYEEELPNYAMGYQDGVRKVLKEVAEGKHRPQGEWGKWIIAEIQCPNCFEYFETDCYSTEELNKCPNCGSIMR